MVQAQPVMNFIGRGLAVTNCGLCDSGNLRRILDLGIQPLAEVMREDAPSYPLRLVECGDCELVQLDYIAPQEQVFPPEHPYASGNAKALHEHFQALADELSPSLADGDLVVDIGCNDGTLLSKFSRKVCKAGVEPTNQINKLPPGIAGYQGFFSPSMAKDILEHSHGQAKIITCTNVLAHVPDPHDFLEGVKLLLADDGVFVTENHSLESVLGGQWDTVYHEHLRYYTPRTLSRLLKRHGLAIKGFEEIDTHGGSFRSYVVKSDGPTLRGPSLHAPDLQPDAQRVADTLQRIVRPGTVGIGATTRASAVIHFAGLQHNLASVCEVSTSEKIGLVMPGTHISVVDEAILFGPDQPECAILFSWHLARGIVPKLRAKGFKGDILLPLPAPNYA